LGGKNWERWVDSITRTNPWELGETKERQADRGRRIYAKGAQRGWMGEAESPYERNKIKTPVLLNKRRTNGGVS